MSTSQWLRELGAVRPMAPASGFYPITWHRYYDKLTRDMDGNHRLRYSLCVAHDGRRVIRA